jgi:pimeloyl-CoA dehydrogenase
VAVGADRVLGTPGQAADAVEAALDAAIAALCAEAVGAVDALLVQTAEHLRTRKQFGAPLAKYQVLQHRMADMAIALEQLKSMACAAAMALQSEDATQRRPPRIGGEGARRPARAARSPVGHPAARRHGHDR